MMKILICGANGFVGRHITAALRATEHTVVRGVRKPSQPNDIAVDYNKDSHKEAWLAKLTGIDVVINAVGVLRDSAKQPMALVHEQTPIALFSACQQAGVKRLVQISALGVDQGVETTYFQTRRAPEAFLNTLPDTLRYLILRPSVIYGDDGVSAKMFRFLASLPVHSLPAGGKQQMQPVHIDDICTAITHWLADDNAHSQTVAAVGLDATDMRGMLDSYRQQLQHSHALHVYIPAFVIKLSALIGDIIPASPLCSDTLTMLNAGNTGDASAFTQLLGRSPRSYRTFISGDSAGVKA
ncbi:NAD-dependent epimerase/dehydratase family protein [Crenothrix polyspora]|nr:NAD-dependent epimerase/dehydratase family protein [Crenothrix polyspora]